jgi:hypothetical protein
MATRRGKALYVATSSGVVQLKDGPFHFHTGQTHVREGHPALRAVPMYFMEAEDRTEYESETTTAEPAKARGAQD